MVASAAVCAADRCEWKHAGVKVSAAGSRPVEVSTSSWQPAGDYYERFTHAAAQQVLYEHCQLIQTVMSGPTDINQMKHCSSRNCRSTLGYPQALVVHSFSTSQARDHAAPFGFIISISRIQDLCCRSTTSVASDATSD